MQLTDRQSREALTGAGLALARPNRPSGEIGDWYLGFSADRALDQVVVVASAHSGVTASGMRQVSPVPRLASELVDAGQGLLPFQARNILSVLAVPLDEVDRLVGFLMQCYYAMISLDGVALEIRRCVVDRSEIAAEGVSLAVDDNALWRRPELAELVGLAEEFSSLPQAARLGLRYHPRSGDTGIIVTGSPLGALTSTYLEQRGLDPGPQVDLGPAASSELAWAAMSWVLHQPRLRLTVVNLVCGYNYGDSIVEGLCRAVRETKDSRPVVIRVAGHGDQPAWERLEEEGIPFVSARNTRDLVDQAVAISGSGGE